MCKRMLLASVALYLLFCLQECLLAGSEEPTANENISATGERTTGKTQYVLQSQGCSKQGDGPAFCSLQHSLLGKQLSCDRQKKKKKSMKAF